MSTMVLQLSRQLIDRMAAVFAAQQQGVLPLHPPAAAAAVHRLTQFAESLLQHQQHQTQQQYQKQHKQQQHKQLQQQQQQEREPQRPRIRQAAVLVPLCSSNGEACCLFTLRSAFLSSHSNQICFPGGAVEPGETLEAAALRETVEEIGDAGTVSILGRTQPVLCVSLTRSSLYRVIFYIRLLGYLLRR